LTFQFYGLCVFGSRKSENLIWRYAHFAIYGIQNRGGGASGAGCFKKKIDEGTHTGKLGFLPLVELHLLLALHLRIIIVCFGELIDQGLDRRTMKFSAVEANGKKMEQELCTESG